MKNLILLAIFMVAIFLSCNVFVEDNPGKLASFSASGKQLVVFSTAKDSNLRLSKSALLEFKKAQQPKETEIAVFVNPDKTFQSFLGIGAAITDASAEVFAALPANKQEEFLKSYFSKTDGIGYTLLRTNIHSCDFSSSSYTYVEEGDKELKTFNIAHDKEFRIPMIKRAIEASGGKIVLYASPWSPPAFMKDTKNMLRGGKLLPEYMNAWANYYVKFIKAYEKEGMPIWGITIQNEPMATQSWESCIFTAEEERDFLKNYLGPIMEKNGLGDKKIIVWDHNRDLMTHRANTIFSDPDAAKYAWGLGFHWYETWTGGEQMYANEAMVNASFPDKKLMFTEGCVEKFNSERYQYWPNAEKYGSNIINDFNCGTVGWTDWNILLDNQGGPNHVGNFCFSPVHADNSDLVYTPSYYYLGHFSKFIRPGAKRVSAVASRSALICTSFLNENGVMVTVVMNKNDVPIHYKLIVGDQETEVDILPHAIQTLVY